MGYLFLSLAIAAEVAATSFLRVASQPDAPWYAWWIVTIGYVFAFFMLSRTLAIGVPLGTAYAVWAGVGVALVAVVAWLVFREPLTWVQIGGIVLVGAGVAMLEPEIPGWRAALDHAACSGDVSPLPPEDDDVDVGPQTGQLDEQPDARAAAVDPFDDPYPARIPAMR